MSEEESLPERRLQISILADRYMEMLLADRRWSLPRLLAALGLGAAIGALVRFEVLTDAEHAYTTIGFGFMTLAAACSCTEIVRERAFFLRERHESLRVDAFLYSRFRVLMLFHIVQAALATGALYGIAEIGVAVGWLFFELVFVLAFGTSIGLFVSSRATSWRVAYALVPLLTAPQLLLTPLFITDESKFDVFLFLSPVYWSIRSLSDFATPGQMLEGVLAMLAAGCFATLGLGATYYSLRSLNYRTAY
jgi:ABC-type polysaccharide/polyol phosphate export permease